MTDTRCGALQSVLLSPHTLLEQVVEFRSFLWELQSRCIAAAGYTVASSDLLPGGCYLAPFSTDYSRGESRKR